MSRSNPFNIPGGPIDWEAGSLEASAPRGPKGKKHSAAQRAKTSASLRATFKRKRQALADALKAQREAEARAPKVEVYDPWAFVTVTDRLLGSMQPGEWYAFPDMVRVAPAVKYQAVKAFAVTWWKQGILKRVQNPAWRPVKTGQRQEPKYLYALAPEGERRHRLAAALL